MRKAVLGALALVTLGSVSFAMSATTDCRAPTFPLATSGIPLGQGEFLLAPEIRQGLFPQEETIHVDGNNNDGIGLTNGGTFYTAARLTPTMTCSLVAVVFYQRNPSQDDYYFVYGPGTQTQPGPVIESVPYTGGDSARFKRLDLPSAIALTAGTDFWLGPRFTHSAGQYPAGCDAGPAVRTVGDWLNYTGTWQELYQVNPALDFNWNIRAIVRAGASAEHDVAVTAVVAPNGAVVPGPLTPQVTIRNYGSNPENDIPVTCWIDSAGIKVYDHTVTYNGPLNPGASASVFFSPDWIVGPAGNTYGVKAFTALAGDENRGNDTVRGSCFTRGFGYTEVWAMDIDHVGALGVTPVQDTLFWISSGGVTANTDPNYVLIYDARTRTFLDSFPQYIPEATSPWGYRDLAYDRANDVVYAGGEGNRLDVINATTHELVRTQTLRGNALPGTVRALAFDGESLYSANFNTAPVSKFSVNGTNCHQRAAVPPFSIYGLALDHGHGLVYGSTADNSGELLIYEYPSWALTDSVKIPEIVGGTMGGCETWLGDTFLLVIGQETPDKLHCFRLNMPLGVAEMPGSSRTMARIMTMTPARGGIEIHYFLERSGRVELAVYDASGRLVQRLVPCLVGAGSRLMTWGLTGSNGQRVVPGTYFCRLSVDGTSVIGKSIVLD